jgi:hypothetical protein
VEGLFFFGSFAYVYFLRNKGLLPGLAVATNWVFRDETMHIEGTMAVIHAMKREYPHLFDADLENRVVLMIDEALAVEMHFCEDALSFGVTGISPAQMRQYLEYCADQRLTQLGFKKRFMSANPFPFMVLQDVQPLTNFFEKRVTEYQKGFDIAIRALTYLPEHIKFVIVGDGAEEAGLRDLVRELGLKKRVLFTGRVDRSVVTLYRKACDIFIAPSRSEGLGNAFVSALASRLPLVTSGVGGIADYARDGETAWILPELTPEAIAVTVKSVLANPSKARDISTKARELVEKEYNWDIIAKAMKDILVEAGG